MEYLEHSKAFRQRAYKNEILVLVAQSLSSDFNDSTRVVGKQGERRRGTLEGPILEAAAEVFIAEGWSATHMERVAKAAGVALATLYRYFPSKEELLDSAFRQEVTRLEEPWRDAAGDAHNHEDSLARYARVFYGFTLDWAGSPRALGLLLTMAEAPGLFYAFLVDQVEVYEHWIGVSDDMLEDPKWRGAHAMISATGFYALLLHWARGSLRPCRPDFPRKVPHRIPDSDRPFHVPRPCEFTAEELAEWYTRRRLQEFGIYLERVSEIMRSVNESAAESPDRWVEGA